MHCAGGTGEGSRVEPGPKSLSQLLRRGYGQNVAVGVHHIDLGPSSAQRVGNHIAGNGGTGQENALATNQFTKRRYQALGDINLRHNCNLKAITYCRLSRCFANCGYLEPFSMSRVNGKTTGATANSLNRV